MNKTQFNAIVKKEQAIMDKICQKFYRLQPEMFVMPEQFYDLNETEPTYDDIINLDCTFFVIHIDNIRQIDTVIDYCRLWSKDISPLIDFKKSLKRNDISFILVMCPTVSFIYDEDETRQFTNLANKLSNILNRHFAVE